jgi:hypothetical protein
MTELAKSQRFGEADYSFAVKPMPRRFGAGGFISLRVGREESGDRLIMISQLFVEAGLELGRLAGEFFICVEQFP